MVQLGNRRLYGLLVGLAITALAGCNASVSTAPTATAPPSSSSATVPPTTSTGAAPTSPDSACAAAAAVSSPDAAKELYQQLLAAPGASQLQIACAAAGLAALAATSPSTERVNQVEPAAKGWANFYTQWVTPFSHLFIPFLVVLALLLGAARVLTRIVVHPGTYGASSTTNRGVSLWFCLYWVLGIGSVTEAAWLMTIGHSPSTAWGYQKPYALGWVVPVVIGILFIGTLLVTGKASASKSVDSDSSTGSIGFDSAVAAAVIALTVFAGCWSWPRPEQWLQSGLMGLAFALVGCWIIARIRGAQIGMLIQGLTTKDGNDNAGIGQLIRSQLYALGSTPPRGILVPQQTDVTDLPKTALGLLPDGNVAKAVALIVQIFLPASPWRVVVTELDPLALQVSMFRNGQLAAAHTIRPGTVGFPSTSSAPKATTPDPDAPTNGDMYTAAAAFILFELAKRFPYLRVGLSGARDWRSIASQSAALSASPVRGHGIRVTLLSQAVAVDPDNTAARLALVTTLYGRDPERYAELAGALEKLKAIVDAERSSSSSEKSAIWLRLRFNLTVAWCNLAEHLESEDPLPLRTDGLPDEISAGQARGVAAAYAIELQLALRDRHHPSKTGRADIPGSLENQMSNALTFVRQYIHVVAPNLAIFEITVRSGGQAVIERSDLAFTVEPVAEIPNSMLALYERACMWAANPKTYRQALQDLSMVATLVAYREWARRDPSFERLRTSASANDFRQIVCDPAPRFVELAPFADRTNQLKRMGIVEAADLSAASRYSLSRHLSIAPRVAQEWHDLAALGLLPVQSSHPTTVSDMKWLVLFLGAGIDSVGDLMARLGPAGSTRAVVKRAKDLADQLRLEGLDYIITPPSHEDLAALRDS